jgi:hypothetical protein
MDAVESGSAECVINGAGEEAKVTDHEDVIGLTGIRWGLHASKASHAVALWCNG